MLQTVLKRWVVYILVVVVGVLAGLQVAALIPATASATGEGTEANVADPSPLATTEYVCTPENVAVFENRIHCKCTVANGSIRYFALSTTNWRFTNRVLSLLLTAKAAGKRVGIIYDPNDLSGTAIGCQAGDCRLIVWTYIVD